jgi:DNA-binding NarL/FixJ family response regulator
MPRAPDDKGDGEGVPPPEELEVMALIVRGLSDRAVAEHLEVSVTTVRRRARRFCNRLGVSTRIEACMEARRLGWL